VSERREVGVVERALPDDVICQHVDCAERQVVWVARVLAEIIQSKRPTRATLVGDRERHVDELQRLHHVLYIAQHEVVQPAWPGRGHQFYGTFRAPRRFLRVDRSGSRGEQRKQQRSKSKSVNSHAHALLILHFFNHLTVT